MQNSNYASSQYSAQSSMQQAKRPIPMPAIRGGGNIKKVRNISANKSKGKFSMKNWIRNKLHRFIFPQEEAEAGPRLRTSEDELGYHDDNSIKFQITSARGGLILSMRHYDNRTDRSSYTNYVISDAADPTEEIAKIVSMEMLRHTAS